MTPHSGAHTTGMTPHDSACTTGGQFDEAALRFLADPHTKAPLRSVSYQFGV